MIEKLRYIYDRLRPFKLDDDDRSCVCPDLCGTTLDVVDDAGVSQKELDALPRDVYSGIDETLTPNSTVKEGYHIFSKSALGAYING